ncbi:MAG: glycosyltransferase family 2 protein [Janthinobacterium lividum]
MSQLIKGLLTIGIPTYNGGFNFPELLLSIKKLGLDETEFEVLVVNNGSTDDTDKIMEQYKVTVPNLRYYKNNKNIGRIENWNKVIELAQGDYLIIMNVNDRFVDFEARKVLEYLNHHPEVPMILSDIQFEDHIYPNWIECGLLNLETYLKKTFLDTEYLEFHSVGILQQHIFRTKVIVDNCIQFNPRIPRTTDRVFVGQVVAAGGRNFYYINKTMVTWHLSPNRYHYQIHNNKNHFNFEELWVNEYEANIQLADLGKISYKAYLKSQLISAKFYMHVKHLRYLKDKILRTNTPTNGMEIPTAAIFYSYLKTMAELNHVSINYVVLNVTALKRAITWYLRSINLYKKNRRSLKGLIIQV